MIHLNNKICYYSYNTIVLLNECQALVNYLNLKY